ncbi:MAG: hypothetical protein ACRDDH_11740 [Cetobacterium sp.]|uniref:hypothetical protein n=1 Tax=Cetobacterium sp. TaxID=2071632 RepID=UPI003EE6A941
MISHILEKINYGCGILIGLAILAGILILLADMCTHFTPADSGYSFKCYDVRLPHWMEYEGERVESSVFSYHWRRAAFLGLMNVVPKILKAIIFVYLLGLIGSYFMR